MGLFGCPMMQGALQTKLAVFKGFPSHMACAAMAQISQTGPELYCVPCGHLKSEWRVPARYSPQSVLGTGVYGTVVKAFDNVAQRHVAIKKINRDKLCKNAAEALRALREIAVLRRLSHPNIVAVLDAFDPVVGDDGLIQSL